MSYFSTLAHYVEQLADHIPEDDFLKATNNTNDLLDDCLSMLSVINKMSFHCEHENMGSSYAQDLADVNTSLSELGALLTNINSRRQLNRAIES